SPPTALTVPSPHSTNSTITTVQSNRSPLRATRPPWQAGAHEQHPTNDRGNTDPGRNGAPRFNGSVEVADLQLGPHARLFRSWAFSALLFFDRSARCARS